MTTRNVSETGVMFDTEQELPVGALVEFKLQPEGGVPITASGRIVHVEQKEGRYRAAVHITDTRSSDRVALVKLVQDTRRGGAAALVPGIQTAWHTSAEGLSYGEKETAS